MAKITMIGKCTWTGRTITTLKEGIAVCLLSAVTVGIGHVPCGDLEAMPVELLQKKNKKTKNVVCYMMLLKLGGTCTLRERVLFLCT